MRQLPSYKYIPKDSELVARPDIGAEVYKYGKPQGTSKFSFVALGYRGKSTKAVFHNSFVSDEQRQKHIDEFFKGVELSEKAKATWKAEKKQQNQTRKALGYYERVKLNRYLSTSEVAEYIKTRILAKHWPETKFSVTSDQYSMGCSIDIRWTDGPTKKQVDGFTKGLQSAGFDGMIDMKYDYNHFILPDETIVCSGTQGTSGSMGTVSPWKDEKPEGALSVNISADYIHTNRETSPALIGAVIAKLAVEYHGANVPTVEDYKEGRAWNTSPMGNWRPGEHHWSWQSIIGRALSEYSAVSSPVKPINTVEDKIAALEAEQERLKAQL